MTHTPEPEHAIINATIRGTQLGFEDHGCLTSWLHLDLESSSQSFGGYIMDTYDEKAKRRVGHEFGAAWILGVLETLGVDSWEKLTGTNLRVVRENKDWGAKIIGVGHIVKNQWFVPEKVVEEMQAKEIQ